MPELIDKNALQEALREEYDRHKALYDEIGHIERGGIVQGLSYAKMILCKQPTIEPEVRHGEWVETEPDEDDRKIGIEFSIKCSRCHDENSHLNFNENHEITGKTFWKSRFCPNCGAYMRGVSKDAGSKTD